MRFNFTIILTLFIFSLGFSQKSDIYQKIKINYSDNKKLNHLINAGVCIDHGIHKKNHFFISDFSLNEVQIIKSLNFDFEVLIDDVTQYYKERNKNNIIANSTEYCDNNIGYITPANYDYKDADEFGGFYTYDEMISELDDMFNQFPELISQRTEIKDETYNETPHIHQTHEGRFLQMVKISDNPNVTENEPQILYTALHHAREPGSMQQLIFFMWYLLENYYSDNQIRQIIDSSELFFVPCVNPDGYIYNETIEPSGGGMWRKNRRDSHGVDNNRNYSFIDESGNEVWNTSGTSNNINANTYAGESPFSEAENRAIRHLIESNNFKIALNNHTYGNLLLYPYGYDYNQPTQDNEIFEFISSELVSENGYNNIISSDLYPAAGDSDDFMYGMLITEENELREKIFAMTPEIGSSFWPQASSIENLCKEMVNLNLTVAKMIGNFATLTDNSGNFISSYSFQSNFSIKRLGLVDNENFTVSLEAVSQNINSISPPINFDSINIGEIIYDSFDITLSESIIPGDEIVFNYILYNGSFEEVITVKKLFGDPQIIYEDESDNFQEYWTDNSEWSTTYEDFYSPETSITDSPYSNYENDSEEIITLSNFVNLSGFTHAEINFNAKWDIENGYDYVQLEISNDGGNTWIPQCGNYTNKGIETHNFAFNQPLYDGLQSEWINEVIKLTDYLNEEISIRFKLYTDGGLRKDGFYFDNFKIKGLTAGLSSNIEYDYLKSNVYPNPVKNYLHIQSSNNIYKIEVYDLLGRLILNKPLVNNKFQMSNFNPGIYIIKLYSESGIENIRIIKE